MFGNSWEDDRLAACQEELISLELDIALKVFKLTVYLQNFLYLLHFPERIEGGKA
jgi:hypothetical protein